ncbi:TonB-dependent receptor [Paludibaculum fermentans]|uniref:TonB-dependent receptor n=1 Tax=Paludibaculum fermentans TaxID=1473598 RepID=UPI003EC103DA
MICRHPAYWLATCIFISFLHAESRTSAIAGAVTDESGAAIPRSSVTLRNLETGNVRTAAADEAGRFRIAFLELGRYEVTFEAPGFSTQTVSPVELTLDREAIVNPALKVAGHTSALLVSATVKSVDASAAALSTLIGQNQIQELPLNGRDYLQLATLQPGVLVARAQGRNANTGFGIQLSISGSRPVQNSYRLDGISVSDHTNSTPGSINGLNLGVDAIREFVVLNNTYGAQYGRAAGGVINAATRSGGNDLHGTLYAFLRNDNLDARNFFDGSGPPEFRRTQAGASAGGPVVKNKLFFFANTESLWQARGSTTINTTVSDRTRTGVLNSTTVRVDPAIARVLALFPHANGQYFGETGLFIFSNQTTGHERFLSTRVDWLATSSDSLFLRYNLDSGNRNSQTPFALGEQLNNTRTQSAVVEGQHVFSAHVMNAARFGFSRSVTNFNVTRSTQSAIDDPALIFVPGARSVGLINVPGLTQFPGGSEALDAELDAFSSFQAYDDFTLSAGRHILNAGAFAERTRFNQDSRSSQNGELTFASLADFLTNTPQRLRAQLPGSGTVRGFRQSIAGGYLQDAWRLTPRLRIDLGLRYEWTSVPAEVNGLLSNLDELTSPQMRTSGPLFANPSRRNFAPRAGLAWNLSARLGTVLRAGYGLYDDLVLSQFLLITGVRNPPFYLRGDANSLAPGDFPNGLYQKLVNSPSIDLRAERIPRNFTQPYLQQWNVNLQQPLGSASHLELAYVGSHGLHLSALIEDANLAVPTTLPDGRLYWPAGGKRLNPAFGMIRNRTFDGQSFYQAGLLNFTGQSRRGLTWQAAYTFSKSIDDDSVTFAHNESSNSIGIPVNNVRFNRGLSNFDLRHTFVANTQWLSPRLRSNWGRLFSTWRIGGVITRTTGLPFSATLGYDAARTLTGRPDRLGGQRPNLAPGASNNPVTHNPLRWIDPSAFQRPTPGFLGNLGRNTITGPDLFQSDLFLGRIFHPSWAGDRVRLDFRAEAYNATNHTNFDLPDPTRMQVFSSNSTPEDVGRITSAGPSREIQFGLKVVF